jgi:hypothetical protein
MELKDIKLTPLLDTLRLQKISDQEYFSVKYNGYISNSRLGLINPQQDGSPEKFFKGFTSGYSQAFALGSAVHELVLQPESFYLVEDIGKPTAKLGAMADELYNTWLKNNSVTKEDIIKASDKIDYYKGKITDDLVNKVITSCTNYWQNRKNYTFDDTKEPILLDYRSIETTKSCVEALSNNKGVQDLLHPIGLIEDSISEMEQAILLDVKAECPNGESIVVRLKSKLDNYTIDFDTNTITVNDVKTIGKIVSEIDNNIVKFHYSRELAMYLYLLRLCSQKFYNMKNPITKANYLVVSTVPNFYSKVRAMSKQELEHGFKEFTTLLRYVIYCMVYKGYNFGTN